MKQKVDAAKWFVDAIAQRQNTLTQTMQAIVDHQRAYFLSGDEVDLKPMILKDIAERIGMDISTVSRVANSKYVQTPYGTLSLKIVLLRRHQHRQWRRGEFSRSQENPQGRHCRRGQAQALVRRETSACC